MNFKKFTLVLSCFLVSSFINAQDKGTVVARFMIEPLELKNHVIIFVNNTGNTIALRHIVKDHDSGKFYKQEPILKNGDSLTVDFSTAGAFCQKWKPALKRYEFSLEILRVLSSPNRLTENVTQGLKKCRMKSRKNAHLIDKSDFLLSSRVEFLKDKNGYLECKLSSGSAKYD